MSLSSPKKHQNRLRSLFLSGRCQNSVHKHTTKKFSSVGSVEELFEEGSAVLEERYVDTSAVPFPSSTMLHNCIIRPTCVCSMFLCVMPLGKQKQFSTLHILSFPFRFYL